MRQNILIKLKLLNCENLNSDLQLFVAYFLRNLSFKKC